MTCAGGGPLSASFGASEVTYWSWIAGATTVPLADGIPAPTTVGTATARALAATDILTGTRRSAYVSAAAINSLLSFRSNVFHLQSGLVTPGGGRFKGAGWKTLWQMAISDAVLNTEAQMFVGLRNSTAAPTIVNPNTIQGYGFGHGIGENTLKFYSRDAAGNSVVVDTGLPITTGADAFWRCGLQCDPGQGAAANAVVRWMVEQLNTGLQASGVVQGAGSLSPLAQLTPSGHRNTGTVNAAAVALDMTWWRFETQL